MHSIIFGQATLEECRYGFLSAVELSQLKLVGQFCPEPSGSVNDNVVNLVQMTYCPAHPPKSIIVVLVHVVTLTGLSSFRQHPIFIHCQFRRLEVSLKLDTAVLIQCVHVAIQHSHGSIGISGNMHRQRIRQPMHLAIGPQCQNP